MLVSEQDGADQQVGGVGEAVRVQVEQPRRLPDCPGVVDHDIEVPEPVDCGEDQRLDLLVGPDVGSEEVVAVAEPLAQFLPGVAVDVADDDVGSFLEEQLGDGEPDAAGAASDHGRLIGELCGHGRESVVGGAGEPVGAAAGAVLPAGAPSAASAERVAAT